MADYDYSLTATVKRVLVEVIPGEPLSVSLPILDSTGANVTVADNTAWSALAQARTDWRSSTVLHTFTTAGASPNITITEATPGVVVLTATAAETAAWQTAWTISPPSAVADVFVTDNSSVEHCIASLVLAVLPVTTVES